jgi:hypothetical protein
LFVAGNPGAVSLNGRIIVDTVLNAVSVATHESVGFNLGATGESEIWVLVGIDKQPWSLHAGTPHFPSKDWGASSVFFPKRNSETQTSSAIVPKVSLYLGHDINLIGITVNTIEDAKVIMIPPTPDISAKVVNESSETATVTVQLVRVWR